MRVKVQKLTTTTRSSASAEKISTLTCYRAVAVTSTIGVKGARRRVRPSSHTLKIRVARDTRERVGGRAPEEGGICASHKGMTRDVVPRRLLRFPASNVIPSRRSRIRRWALLTAHPGQRISHHRQAKDQGKGRGDVSGNGGVGLHIS